MEEVEEQTTEASKEHFLIKQSAVWNDQELRTQGQVSGDELAGRLC